MIPILNKIDYENRSQLGRESVCKKRTMFRCATCICTIRATFLAQLLHRKTNLIQRTLMWSNII